MSGVNKAIVVGRLARDPELRYTANGQSTCKFTVATSENWKDKDGNKQDRVEWHSVVSWGKLAEICGQYLYKGCEVYVEGKLSTRSWEKEGIKHYRTEIVASTMEILSPRKEAPLFEAGNVPAPQVEDEEFTF